MSDDVRRVLWAPWRMTYVGAKAPVDAGCIFCTATAKSAEDALRLGATPHAVIMLNRYPYASAHVMVAPRRHTASLMDLPDAEHADLQEALRRTVATLQSALTPGGMNVGLNLGRCAGAGIADHLHWHVVPRWDGDTNFMPLLADVRVMPQHLLETLAVLRSAFEPWASVE
jgi:ATP adenylyltransferase